MAASTTPGLPLSLQPFINEAYLLMTHINPGAAWLKSVINSGLFMPTETLCTHDSCGFENPLNPPKQGKPQPQSSSTQNAL